MLLQGRSSLDQMLQGGEMNENIENRIKMLESAVQHHQNLYYNADPEITDEQFDALWDELAALDPGSPVLAGLGRDEADGWPKAPHIMPMGSQNKATSPEEFFDWTEKRSLPLYLVQYKLDGASLELQYNQGKLVRAVTRGDGITGDDITPNAVKMAGVVSMLPIPYCGAVRGEVIMTREVHRTRHPEKANCRNAANGVMKRKDGQGASDLAFICYDAFVPAERICESPYDDEKTKLQWLELMGFQVVHNEICTSAAEVIALRARVMDIRPLLDYDIDGLVVKGIVIDRADASRARPEYQIAFKFSPEEAVSTLRKVEWNQSGATFTPVGIVDPVRLAGTVVKRANLCNPNLIAALKIQIGSRVVLTKRGEIIPKIESLVENPPDAVEISIPSVCDCGTALVNEGTRLYCPRLDCPSRTLHRLQKWVSVLAIDDFGPAIVERLFKSGRVQGIADLYSLTVSELSLYERMGETLAAKLVKNLTLKNLVPLPRFIAGLDIEGVGELLVGRVVASGYATLARIREASASDLSGIFGIGDRIAAILVDGLVAVSGEIDAILATGKIQVLEGESDGPLSGKSFCFTGELSSLKRAQAEELVKSLGGSIKSSITKDLKYLVTNDPGSGSSKNKKAASLGIPLLDEESFLNLIKSVRADEEA